MNPFFTIIIATLNSATSLGCLLESLSAQECRNFEVLIQDGGSTDDTLTIAEGYREKLPFLFVQNGPDTGIYEAWNKILPFAGGEWVLFLGADDQLAEEGSLMKAESLLRHVATEVLYAAGDVGLFTAPGDCFEIFIAPGTGASKLLRKEMPFCHTGLFHRRSLFFQRQFDTFYRVLGDYEFLCRTLMHDFQAVRLGFTVTHMALGGISSKLCRQPHIFRESLRIAWKHFRGITMHHVTVSLKVLLVALLCRILGGARAAAFVDTTRVWRGKRKRWAVLKSPASNTIT